MDLHAEHSSSKMKVTGGLATALATPSLLLLATPASGQTTEPAQLTPIQVGGTRPAPFNVMHSASDKFTAPVLDTSKSLKIVPQELIQSQAASALTDVLRNSPGITFGAGEGGNPLGDRPFIRGYDAQSSTFIDGMRDIGATSREVFNLEQVEVIKGADGAYTGRGSAGGGTGPRQIHEHDRQLLRRWLDRGAKWPGCAGLVPPGSAGRRFSWAVQSGPAAAGQGPDTHGAAVAGARARHCDTRLEQPLLNAAAETSSGRHPGG